MQSLPGSEGSCASFQPEVQDIDFDGWPDLMIGVMLPAGPNIPYSYWLFNPRARRFDDAPPGLDGLTSPAFDPARRIVWNDWRASCCEHGVSIFKWKKGDLVKIDEASSYLLPVMDGKVPRYCYVTPSYEAGRIVFNERVEKGIDGILRLTFAKLDECHDENYAPQRSRVDVWQRAPAAGRLYVIRTEETRWKKTRTRAGIRYCQEVPFFDNGRIRRIVMKDDPDSCIIDNPE